MTEYSYPAMSGLRGTGNGGEIATLDGDQAPVLADGRGAALRGSQLATARGWLFSGGSVLFFGQLGIGKSAVLDEFVAATDRRVLCCAPTPTHADLGYFALAELLATVTEEEFDRLPAPQRRELTTALQGWSQEPPEATEPAAAERAGAVPLAVWNLLRLLADAQPLLLVVDDIQWLDAASVEVLRFVAATVGHLPIQMVAAERVWRGRHPHGYDICPPPLLMLGLDPVVRAEAAGRLRRVA